MKVKGLLIKAGPCDFCVLKRFQILFPAFLKGENQSIGVENERVSVLIQQKALPGVWWDQKCLGICGDNHPNTFPSPFLLREFLVLQFWGVLQQFPGLVIKSCCFLPVPAAPCPDLRAVGICTFCFLC